MLLNYVVMLQPMQEDPPADFKCKDKFLVQCVPFRLTADFNTDDTKDLVPLRSIIALRYQTDYNVWLLSIVE